MTAEFHPLIREDLREILRYYDERSDSAGDRFYQEFETAVEKIEEKPLRFHRIDAIRHRCNLKKFPYHLVYEIYGNKIFITVLRHHKRHPSFGMRRKIPKG